MNLELTGIVCHDHCHYVFCRDVMYNSDDKIAKISVHLRAN